MGESVLSLDLRKHRRHSIRYPGYDYSLAGGYFVTIVTYQRRNLFGQIDRDHMVLLRLGMLAKNEWLRSAEIRKEIRLFEDEMVIMPNHLHGIVWIEQVNDCPMPLSGDVHPYPNGFLQKRGLLGSFIAGFKTGVSMVARRESDVLKVWQRNYYNHIIRNDTEYDRIMAYIQDNPRRWQEDELFGMG